MTSTTPNSNETFNAIAAAAVAGSLATSLQRQDAIHHWLHQMETMLHAGLNHEEAFYYAVSEGQCHRAAL